jgi:hypothetical protein
VRPVLAVVVDEDAEHALEVSLVDDEQPVETLRACGADEALGDRVRLRCSDRRADDLDPFASEDGVEVTGELAVAITDQEPSWRRSLRQRLSELTGLLDYPGATGVRRAQDRVNAPHRHLVGYAKSVSRGEVVFVEESAESVSALDGGR